MVGCQASSDADPALVASAIDEASDLLYALSGRRWPGTAVARARPVRGGCACWGVQLLVGPGVDAPAVIYGGGNPLWDGRRWHGADALGSCGWVPAVELSGSGPFNVTEVTIGGVVVDPATYHLDGEYLIRHDGGAWPWCQDMTRPPGDPGTFVITYEYGHAAPPSGVAAANQLACELLKASLGKACALPSGVTRVTRQGVTIERQVAARWGMGRTGLALVDVFLDTTNPNRLARRASVWSPDVPQPARRITP